MPLIQVFAPRDVLSQSEQDALMSRLSNAVLKAERAPVEDNAAQSLVWAYFHELDEGTIYVGGKSQSKPPFRVAVTTPQGALNAVTRQELIREIGIIIDEITGTFDGRLNHWATLYEVADGSWGSGQVLHLPDIQAAMHIERLTA